VFLIYNGRKITVRALPIIRDGMKYSNLTTVHLTFCQSVDIFVTDLVFRALNLHCLIEKYPPNLLSRLEVKIWIVDRKVNAT
jgi:hypothetical protein